MLSLTNDPVLGFPRARLAHAPTPMDPLDAIMRQSGHPHLYVKRDDLTGLAMGGNKARQLEYYFGAALAEGADTVLITGAVQSNFVRMCAAAARKLGRACEIQLEDRVQGMPPGQDQTGNTLLDRLLGVPIHRFPVGEDEAAADDNLERIANDVRARGGKPYVIHLGPEYPPLGGLGYIDCAREILTQTEALGVPLKTVVVASGSAISHAGILTGFRHYGSNARVFGICVRRNADQQHPRVVKRSRHLADMLGRTGLVTEQDVITTDAYIGEGYGKPTAGTMAAIDRAAKSETLLLDPVYTGKAFDGFLGLLKQGMLPDDGAAVFIHTGGTPGLFAYAHLWHVARAS
ncbi:MAG: D-cysteine desulfhydrase family protein [Rhodospirillales bacterium]|nr:D-cysteine desulfhydrase family protein [Rhodospirillales bacterium]